MINKIDIDRLNFHILSIIARLNMLEESNVDQNKRISTLEHRLDIATDCLAEQDRRIIELEQSLTSINKGKQ